MPSLLPALIKTWQANVNQILPSAGTTTIQYQNVIFAIKQALKGFASNPWTVRGSSSAAGFSVSDGVDRWTTASAIGASHWIILRNTAMGFTLDLMIQTSNSPGAQPGIVARISSGAGFVGGSPSITVAPTATDQVQLGTGSLNLTQTNALQQILNVEMSTDGTCTRIWMYGNNFPMFLFVIDKLKNPIVEMTTPWVAGLFALANQSVLSSAISYSTIALSAGGWQGYHTTALNFALTSEGTLSTGLIGQIPAGAVSNEISGSYFMAPVGVLSQTASKRGRHGEFFDMWLGSTSILDGDTYPGASESPLHQFTQIGNCLVLPFPAGTVPLTA